MKPLDVEPLEDERWQRVEQGVFRALDEDARRAADRPARPRALAFAAVALTASMGALAYVALSITPTPTTRGVATAPAGVSAASPGTEAPAAPPESLVTQALPAAHTWGALAVRASPHTTLRMDAPRGPLHQGRLEAGEISITVPTNAALELALGRVFLRAQAVRFVASYSEYRAQVVEVAVEAGELALLADGATHTLRAGERWPAAVPAPAPKTAPPPRPSSAHGRPSAQERYEQAAHVEGTRPDEAQALYRSLAHERGPWAEHALFALGRLELERGQTARGLATLRRYLNRHPGGPNAQDARRLLGSRP